MMDQNTKDLFTTQIFLRAYEQRNYKTHDEFVEWMVEGFGKNPDSHEFIRAIASKMYKFVKTL